MSRSMRMAVAALVLAAPPLLAQKASLVVAATGGGYSPLSDLSSSPSPVADFKTGYNLGGQVGVQSRHVGVYGDFTYARSRGQGNPEIAGFEFNRYFYGAHVELRQPLSGGWTPFVLGGGGAVKVSESGAGQIPSFTKGAAVLGAGLGYLIPKSRVELLAEGKSMTYKWNAGGFNRTQWDMNYSLGIGYRFRT